MTTPALCLVLMFLSPVRATPISSWQLRPWHHPSCRASEDGQPLHYLSMKCWPTLVSCTLPLSAIMLWTGHCTLLICFTLRHCSTRTHNTPSFFVVQFWGASSPLCWYNNTEILCIDFQSNTTIFHLVQWENTTTTCFGPIGRRSSGCNLDLEISFTRCVCVGGGENEISLFPYWVPWPRVFCYYVSSLSCLKYLRMEDFLLKVFKDLSFFLNTTFYWPPPLIFRERVEGNTTDFVYISTGFNLL